MGSGLGTILFLLLCISGQFIYVCPGEIWVPLSQGLFFQVVAERHTGHQMGRQGDGEVLF